MNFKEHCIVTQFNLWDIELFVKNIDGDKLSEMAVSLQYQYLHRSVMRAYRYNFPCRTIACFSQAPLG